MYTLHANVGQEYNKALALLDASIESVYSALDRSAPI